MMESSTRGRLASFKTLFLLVASRAALVAADGVPLNLCADYNTADTNRNVSIYQTNGLCFNFCKDDYAYAITQETSCWCSNYTPDDSTQVDLDRCDIDCPAYPVEKCGGRGLFGYVELNGHLPSGTKGGDQTSSTSTTPSTSTMTTASVTETETVQTSVESETSSQEETSTTFTTTTTTSSSSTTSSTSEEETSTKAEPTKIETVTTDGGAIRTITITGAPTGNPAESNGNGNDGSGGGGGLGTGGIIGIVVGVVGGILIGAGLILWWFLKRRKQTREEGYQEDPSVRGSSSSRMGGSVGPDMASVGSPASGTHGSNRNSTLHIDPRMDPFKQGLYARNGSHESIGTLRDDHDYSRRILRATNPDPSTEN